ncbi:MAG: hypothetical protein WBO08_05565 [Mycobacterium sp.]
MTDQLRRNADFGRTALLAHEVTNAVVARRAGITGSGVRLWMLGGIATLGSDAKTSKTDSGSVGS